MVDNHCYGWKPGIKDHRDYKFGESYTSTDIQLPPKFSLRSQITWRYNQGRENSCTGNATASLARFVWKKDLGLDVTPSRHFIYYNERKMEDDINKDGGAYIRDGMDSLVNIGFCDEASWGYYPSTLFATPPVACYMFAQNYRLEKYYAIDQDRQSLKNALATGYPFVFGITVHSGLESQETARNGIVPMPTQNDKVLGGHAITMTGWDDTTQHYEFMNSWGESWGDDGFGWLPYDYVEGDLADDFFTARGQAPQVNKSLAFKPEENKFFGFKWKKDQKER